MPPCDDDPQRFAIKRLMVANRSEIAIRIFRAATDLGLRTFAVYADQDRRSLHRFKADEAYQIGKSRGAIDAYLSIDEIISVAKKHRIDAIHPGYGFLAESPEFAEACLRESIVLVGPSPQTMRTQGNKIAARNLATSCGVPVMPASEPLPNDPDGILAAAKSIGQATRPEGSRPRRR
jgi:pyruvate carboxylase